MSVKLNDTAANTRLQSLGLDELLINVGVDIATYAFWAKEESTTGVWRLMSMGSTSTNNADAFITQSVGGGSLQTRGNSSDSTAITTAYTRTNWNLIIAVSEVRGGLGTHDYRAYRINGGTLNSNTGSLSISGSSNRLTLGAAYFNGSAFSYASNLFLRGFCVWNKALSTDEMDLLYGSGPGAGDAILPRDVAPGNVVMYKDLAESESDPLDIGPSLTVENGTDLTAVTDDNPTLIRSLPVGNRRRRLILGY